MGRTALITLSIELNEEDRRSHRFFQGYADKFGFDFRIISEPQFRYRPNFFRKRRVWLHYEKFQLLNWLDRYERVIYLDSDILIHPECPDLLAEVPPGHLGCVADTGGEDAWKRREELSRLEQKWGTLPASGRPYFNGGVLVLDQSHRSLFHLSREDVVSGRWPEQTLLNYRVRQNGTKVHFLDSKFNFLPFNSGWKDPDKRRSAWMIHYAGVEAKLEMARDCEYFLNHFAPATDGV